MAKSILVSLGLGGIVVDSPTQAQVALTENFGYHAMHELLDQCGPPEAVFVADDIFARGVSKALLERRAKAPAGPDLVVVTSQRRRVALGLPVTYVLHDIDEQGRQAEGIVLDQVKGRSVRPRQWVSRARLIHEPVASSRSAGVVEAVRGRIEVAA